MRYIKDFRLFESGATKDIFPEKRQIQDELRNTFTDCFPIVQVDRSKYGDIILIDFKLKDSDNITNYDNLDDRYKTTDFVYETIDILKKYKIDVYLSSFHYLNETVKGAKDGSTIEDVLPKLEHVIDKYTSGFNEPAFKNRNIATLSFLIK